MRRICKFCFLFFLCISFLFCISGACSESDIVFEVKRIGNIHPYADNQFRINTSEPGTVSISIEDGICVYRTITQEVQEGETTIHWDGCGFNRERLYEKSYTISCVLTTETGIQRFVSFLSPVEYALQSLQYALPSGDTIYLNSPEDWFLEYRTVSKGKVILTLTSTDDPEVKYTYTLPSAGGGINRKTFQSFGSRNLPSAGRYLASVYEMSRAEDQYCFNISVEEQKPSPVPVSITGEIMPDRNMTDEEIWDMMMQPSVVIDIDFFRHQSVYSSPDQNSPSLGTLHGQTQGVRVFEMKDGWARIGAWNHEEAEYVEGWVPSDRLTVAFPNPEYAILIDKQKQAMTIYQQGKRIDTLLVSTGKAGTNSLFQETSAGCFLTGYHRVNFSMNGQKYDYVIQYDGGNLLHQTPYAWGNQMKDFTLGRGYLGAKASHACIRIQPEPGEGGINAYWLFTHIPYHTRVVILDDPEERRGETKRLQRQSTDQPDPESLRSPEIVFSDSDSVSMTFGGMVKIGGTPSFNRRRESLVYLLEKEDSVRPFSVLEEIFAEDDLTCVSNQTLFSDDSVPSGADLSVAPSAASRIYDHSSIEMIYQANDTLQKAGQELLTESARALSQYALVLQSAQPLQVTLKGHLFGFAACSEKEYLSDPATIDRRRHRRLRRRKCR